MRNKILRGVTVLLLLIAVLLIIVPYAFRTQLNNWVKNQINNGINAKVDYAYLTITCFKHFPDIDISLHRLSVTGDSLFAGDTLAGIDNLDLTIDLRSLLSGSNYKILQCSINRLRFNFRADSSGRANWNILKQVSLIPGIGVVANSDSSHVTLQIDHYSISDARILYTDAQRGFAMNIRDLNSDGHIQSSIIQSNIHIGSFNASNADNSFFNKLRVDASLHYSLDGDSLSLDTLFTTMGKSDLCGTGKFNNVLASQEGKAVFAGKLNLKSHVFDLNNWLETAFKTGKQASHVNTPVQISSTAKTADSSRLTDKGVSIVADVAFDTIYLNKLLLLHAKAEIDMQRDSVSISDFACRLLGGNATGNLKMVHQREVQFQLNIARCDIQKTCNAVPVAEKIEPVARYIQGSFSAELKAQDKLNDAMNLDYNTLTGDGKIQTGKSKITQIPVLSDIGTLAKNASLSNLEMNPVTSVIHCKNGTVIVGPTDVTFSNGFALNIKGNNTLNGDINYDMRLKVPIKQMGAIAAMAQNFLSGIPGLNIKAPDVMSFSFNVTGTFAKPQARLVNIGDGQ